MVGGCRLRRFRGFDRVGSGRSDQMFDHASDGILRCGRAREADVGDPTLATRFEPSKHDIVAEPDKHVKTPRRARSQVRRGPTPINHAVIR